GSFTITNIGALGGTGAIPIINYPEVAILGVARGREEPVVRGGQIVPRTMLPLSLTFDHRVADGADGARFAQALIRRLAAPETPWARACGMGGGCSGRGGGGGRPGGGPERLQGRLPLRGARPRKGGTGRRLPPGRALGLRGLPPVQGAPARGRRARRCG